MSGWNDYIYFSTNSVWDSQDTAIHSSYRSVGVAVDESYTVMESVSLPQVAAGNYFLILRVDNDNNRAEANENNNSKVFPITVTSPDLTPVEFTGMSSGSAGQSVLLNWTVKNQGTGTALSGWNDYI